MPKPSKDYLKQLVKRGDTVEVGGSMWRQAEILPHQLEVRWRLTKILPHKLEVDMEVGGYTSTSTSTTYARLDF
jgi:hypothetical protein